MFFLASKTNEQFAKRFKELRVKSGYTQQQLANLFKVTRPCICYWKTAKRVPDYTKLVEICKFFNVSSDYMLGVSEIRTINLNEGKQNYDTDNYLDMSQLSEESKRQLKDYYNFLLAKQAKCEADV
mgnify:CR=1 FL=1